jgi:hypothetical protein
LQIKNFLFVPLFASRARAMIPAAIGELALVPVCWSGKKNGIEVNL